MPKRTDISKILALLTGLSFGTAALACSIVEIPTPEIETRNIRFSFTWDGKFAEGATVNVYLGKKPGNADAHAYLTIITQSDGQALLQNLQSGTYEMTIALPGKHIFNSHFKVSQKAGGETTKLPYELDDAWFNGDESVLKKLPTQVWVKSLSGVVLDESGAVIPGAKVRAQVVDTDGAKEIAEATTGTTGAFSLPLQAGKYVAIIRAPGFRTGGIPLEVSAKGEDGFTATLNADTCNRDVDTNLKLGSYNLKN